VRNLLAYEHWDTWDLSDHSQEVISSILGTQWLFEETLKAPGTMALVLGSNRPILGNSASAGLYELPFTSRRVYKLCLEHFSHSIKLIGRMRPTEASHLRGHVQPIIAFTAL
jgi:hypothetical protein